MLSGIQYNVTLPFPIFGAIKREGNKKDLESALAPVSESKSLVEYTRVSLPFSFVEEISTIWAQRYMSQGWSTHGTAKATCSMGT
jgi:predicted AlkP superfamily pyrophosphatase or phosphodiesterase